MTNWTTLLLTAGILYIALFGFSFFAAPHDWALEAYFWAGVLVLLILMSIPWFLLTPTIIWQRVLFSLGFALLSTFVWLGGLFAANIRIITRLF
jgi:hypothetical protein